MNRIFRIFVALTVGLFLIGMTGTTHAGVTSKVKKTAKKTASKAKETAKKGAEKTNDKVHDTANKGKGKVTRADQQATTMTNSLGDNFKEITK